MWRSWTAAATASAGVAACAINRRDEKTFALPSGSSSAKPPASLAHCPDNSVYKDAARASASLAAAATVTAAVPPKKSKAERRFTLGEFRAMADDSERTVVGFKGGVFDITDFTGHPGGVGRLQMANGNDLEAFWQLYTQHNRGHVDGILQRYRIGSLSAADAEALRASSPPLDNPYKCVGEERWWRQLLLAVSCAQSTGGGGA